MTSQPAQLAYTVNEAAKAVGQHPVTIRRAIHATSPETIPPLSARRGEGRLMVEAGELRRWVQSLPDV